MQRFFSHKKQLSNTVVPHINFFFNHGYAHTVNN